MNLEHPKKEPDYGTVEWTYGLGCCATPLVGCGCAIPFIYAAVAIWDRRGLHVSLALSLLAWAIHYVFLEGHIKIDPQGITIGSLVYKRHIRWSSIRRADRAKNRWGCECTVLWTNAKQINLPEQIQHYGKLQMILWRYLRHYAECPPPRTRKRGKKNAAEQNPNDDQDCGNS